MDFTSRMVALLAALRRERNGAVADEMRLFGRASGLNYGVSLPTVRAIARAETPDHAFARFLLSQDVRELRLAAFHIARPECLVADEFPLWAAAIINSEFAEEAAFALLSRAEAFPALFDLWTSASAAAAAPLPAYAALMAAARWPGALVEWAYRAIGLLRLQSVAAEEGRQPAFVARLTAQGAVAVLVAIASQNEQNRLAILRAAGSVGDAPAERFLREELAWRLEL